ncbi:MAG: ribonuclease P protein component [Burkholderiaceae bacterium]|jgi:ribonuclease P protein component|nr:ribonuclease P protein component [Burkholderiaceae bacterium]
MPGRLVHTADFKRVLATAPKARSAHFAAHHVAARPSAPAGQRVESAAQDLSTDGSQKCAPVVDNSFPQAHWAGYALPKRFARRSVTRQLLKRQMREAMRRHAADLPPGLWVLRLRAAFDARAFVSAASVALRGAARDELDALLRAAARR